MSSVYDATPPDNAPGCSGLSRPANSLPFQPVLPPISWLDACDPLPPVGRPALLTCPERALYRACVARYARHYTALDAADRAVIAAGLDATVAVLLDRYAEGPSLRVTCALRDLVEAPHLQPAERALVEAVEALCWWACCGDPEWVGRGESLLGGGR